MILAEHSRKGKVPEAIDGIEGRHMMDSETVARGDHYYISEYRLSTLAVAPFFPTRLRAVYAGLICRCSPPSTYTVATRLPRVCHQKLAMTSCLSVSHRAQCRTIFTRPVPGRALAAYMLDLEGQLSSSIHLCWWSNVLGSRCRIRSRIVHLLQFSSHSLPSVRHAFQEEFQEGVI